MNGFGFGRKDAGCFGPSTSTLVFFVNGKKVIESSPDPSWTLLWYLRIKLRLCGTKLGCAEGGCGACTVMISKYNRKTDNIEHMAVNACLMPVCALHGLAITTVEGIGSTRDKIHPVQERIANAHGSQCGFCTPGIVMSMYALIRNKKNISYTDINEAFQGNLCRCTGYRPIIEGYKTFLEIWEKGYITNGFNGDNKTYCKLGKDCCQSKKKTDPPTELFDKSTFQPYDSTQEPIFPPELKLNYLYDSEFLEFESSDEIWYRPVNLKTLIEIKNKYPYAKLIVGNTEVGVEVKFKNMAYPIKINPTYVSELKNIEEHEYGLTIGGCVTITEIQSHLQKLIMNHEPYKTRIFKSIQNMFHWFAGKQIRNVAGMGGNIMTGSPISDLNPILMASNSILKVTSIKSGLKLIKMNDNFFTGYRKNILKPEELLLSVEIPFTKKTQYFKAYKQSRRKEDDIAIVTAAFCVEFEEHEYIVKNISLAYGGIAATTLLASKTPVLLKGLFWNKEFLNKAFQSLIKEFILNPSAPGGMVEYRKSLILSLFFKFYMFVSKEILSGYTNGVADLQIDNTGIENFCSEIPKCSQFFQQVDSKQQVYDAVGRPVPHLSSLLQATGEAIYIDDMPLVEDELHLALVLSEVANGNILSIDATEALSLKGVEAFFSAEDVIQGRNKLGPIIRDEEVFASKKVQCQGCPVGAIVANDRNIAQKAARLVKITYEKLEPVILTIEDAITAKSFHSNPLVIKKGDIQDAFSNADYLIEGDCKTGAQEHFYLETQSARVVPNENNEFEVYCSNQQVCGTMETISQVLGIPMHRIVVKVKRVGGGFGGKEYRSRLITLPVAIAAQKLRKPVRIMLDRDEDMILTGNRHPFFCKYRASCTRQGKITGLDVTMYSNAGWSMDVSSPIMSRAMFHVTNAYCIPNVRISGYLCKTNIASNTAFRGFGAPQAMFVAETLIRQVANELRINYEEVIQMNLLKQGDLTTMNQTLDHCNLIRCWEECLEKSNYYERKQNIERMNSENRWIKHGISVVPTAFGISFGVTHKMQAGALVNIYTDGSVLVTHGGMEMGQGLHTKMVQVASRALEVDTSLIHITETSSDKVPNASPSAASISSDLNGMAVLRACTTLKDSIKPYKDKNPDGSWADWVKAAYLDRVNLSATGFYKSEEVTYTMEKNSGHLYEYYTYGVAVSEVVIDCLTGDHKIKRTDIVMDLGESLNPAIDVGQIEGGFMQGYGLFTLEEIAHSPTGALLTRGPGTYKIPGFGDIPTEFNVSILKGAPNPSAVYSSKAVGEPPLFLASSVFFALKEAISSARKDAGASSKFSLQAPATAARIRMACEDHITAMIDKSEPGTYKPWSINF